jgi:hypothetical protein
MDRYMTPRHIASSIVRWMRIPPDWTVVEPGVGHGVWLDELAVQGHTGHTIAWDIWPAAPGLAKARKGHVGDFRAAPVTHQCDLVLGNPPFKHALEFVERGLQWAPRVAFLLRGTFVEATEQRAPFWEEHSCTLEWTIGDRIRFLDHQLRPAKGSDSVCHSVFFFERSEYVCEQWNRSIISIARGWKAPMLPWPYQR